MPKRDRDPPSGPMLLPPVPRSRQIRSLGWFWGLLVVLSAVTIAAGWWMFRGWQPQTAASADNQSSRDGEFRNSRAAAAAEPQVDNSKRSRHSDAGVSTSVALTTARSGERLSAMRAKLDPLTDGWESEQVSEAAQTKLAGLLGLIASPQRLNVEVVAEAVTDDFRCQPLRPADLQEQFRTGGLSVWRWSGTSTDLPAAHNDGAAALVSALRQLAKRFSDNSQIRTHVKTIDVEVTDAGVTTTALVDASGQTGHGLLEWHATWRCQWSRTGDALRLKMIQSHDYEEVVTRGASGAWFAECTEAVLGKNQSYQQQLLYGLNHWIKRVERIHGIGVYARCGVAVGDVNGDGLDDLYVCQPGGLPNRLFVQNLDGTATDRSHDAGVDWLAHTSSALLVDLDNDGDQDLVIPMPHSLLVMENDGQGRFQHRTSLELADLDVQSLSAADYNVDGYLDLYVCVGFAIASARPSEPRSPFVYHDSNDGGANVLFRNAMSEDPWSFVDATSSAGLEVDNRRHSLAAAWEDYDNDGDVDLYVANDYGRNCLYRNDAGHFMNVAAQAGVVDFGSGMSVSWGDYDRDGWMDIYVANMFSSAGSRITRQAMFRPEADQSLRAIYQRFAKGNSLFKNDGQGGFSEVGTEAAVEMGRWAWSSLFVDLNNDSWEDLLVANGYVTTQDTGDL
jgi:hypothetical protein